MQVRLTELQLAAAHLQQVQGVVAVWQLCPVRALHVELQRGLVHPCQHLLWQLLSIVHHWQPGAHSQVWLSCTLLAAN